MQDCKLSQCGVMCDSLHFICVDRLSEAEIFCMLSVTLLTRRWRPAYHLQPHDPSWTDSAKIICAGVVGQFSCILKVPAYGQPTTFILKMCS